MIRFYFFSNIAHFAINNRYFIFELCLELVHIWVETFSLLFHSGQVFFKHSGEVFFFRIVVKLNLKLEIFFQENIVK